MGPLKKTDIIKPVVSCLKKDCRQCVHLTDLGCHINVKVFAIVGLFNRDTVFVYQLLLLLSLQRNKNMINWVILQKNKQSASFL